MSTIPLFKSDDSVEDLCLLIKGLHEEMTTVHRKVDVLLALQTGNTEALRDMVAAGPALVVPNEDEAAPVVATCPCCSKTATAETVDALFGQRRMHPWDKETRVQSWCRACRSEERKTAPSNNTNPLI